MNKDLNIPIPGAANFTYAEFVNSEISLRKGIDNVPDDTAWKYIEKLAVDVLQPLREKFGPIRITSGFRSKELNNLVGGSEHSTHLLGQAADIVPYDTSIKLINVLEYINNKLDYKELIAEYFSNIHGWVHVSYKVGENKRQIKIKDIGYNYTESSIDHIKKLYLNL